MKTKPIISRLLLKGRLRPLKKQETRQYLLPSLRIYTSLFMIVILSFFVSCNDPVNDIADKTVEPEIAHAKKNHNLMPGTAQPLTTGLLGASGSAIGPDGALYVAEFAFGRISRIDPKTGDVTTFASDLPLPKIGIGGAWDVAFLGGKAYVLVMLVDDPDPFGIFPVHTGEVNGIYRIDGPNSFSIIADIGQFSIDNPPPSNINIFLLTGVYYSIQPYRGGFLVADGHHNRVLFVTLDGKINVVRQFENIVPTGLEVRGNSIYMAEAGPIPHNPEDGRVVRFGPNSPYVKNVASGAPLLVDVEFNHMNKLFALAQGIHSMGGEGSPADPNTGSLERVNPDGTFTTIVDGLDIPTSLEFIGNTAYIMTLFGDVWTVENVAGPPFGM